MIWFGWLLWYIKNCRFYNTKSSLYISINHIRFFLVGLYFIPIIVGYLMPNPLYTYILDIYHLVWLGISTIVGHLMPNPLYIYIRHI